MKLLCLVQGVVIAGAFLLPNAPAVLADEDCCAGTPACESMKKSKSEAKSKKEVEKVTSEKIVEPKVEEKAPSVPTEKSEKSI